jgi:hypothetical protein
MHQIRLHRIAVVPTHEMQRTVGGEQIEFERKRDAEPTRLASRGVGRDHDLPDKRTWRPGRLERKREHVRAPANAAPLGVEAAYLTVVHHAHLDHP